MLDTGIQFLIKNVAIVHNQFSWIPVSGHWDDIFVFEAKSAITFNTLPSQINVRIVMCLTLGSRKSS
ncbi:hypothetical protein [Wolbachia endosymbiont (group A) of Ennomos erosarius]|uniref:hypothetical protein n=1 Tax=Wolbachia endosymbiont (group A) of Ennomos erosarius TaxID=3066174 RepID=UPI0033401423